MLAAEEVLKTGPSLALGVEEECIFEAMDLILPISSSAISFWTMRRSVEMQS